MGGIVSRTDRLRYLTLKYGDHHGELERAFDLFKLDRDGQLMWLEKWADIDKDGNNMVEFEELISFFELPDNVWSKRLFNLINADLNDALDFLEFFIFAVQHCLINSQALMEFSFRLLSRRGVNFDPENSILDVHDLRFYLEQKYKDISTKEAKRRAEALLGELDADGSGGATAAEFAAACGAAAAGGAALLPLPALGLHYLRRLRRGLFGEDYWQQISPPMPENDIELYGQMKELSDIAVEVSEFEYFADDFPVIYKKFKLKRKQRKEQRNQAVHKKALAGRAYGRLVAWFRRLSLQDTGLRLQAAFRNWHLVSHPEAALALAHQRSSLESFTSLTVGEKPEENKEGEGEGTTRLAPAIQIGAVKGGRRAGLVSPANSRPGSAGHPFGLPPPGSGGGGGGSRGGRRDIYDLLNEPRELRLVPPEVLFEDYLAGYVRNTQERSKHRGAGPTFPEEYRHRRRRPEHWQR